MRLKDIDVIVTGNPPPGFGGRYFIFVKVTTDNGIVGWGECYAATIGPRAMTAVIEDVFARHCAGESPENVEHMFRRAYSAGFTQRADPTVMGAFSGIEIAIWDILGKARERPVWAMLGGCVNDRLRSYSYLYPDGTQEPGNFYNDPYASATRAGEMADAGFTAIKFDPAGPYTVMGGHMPSRHDIAQSVAFCRELRAAVGDRADLLFGTHGQFSNAGAQRLAAAIEPYDPLWFEEPTPPDQIAALDTIARATTIPIATGERLTTKAEFAAAIDHGATILQPALGRAGGIWEAKKIAAIAEVRNAQIAPHLYAGPIEFLANIQLAASLPNFLLLETIETGGAFHNRLLGGGPRWEAGYVHVPDAPGLGFELDEALARAHPYIGDRLHLEMRDAPHHHAKPSDFAGG